MPLFKRQPGMRDMGGGVTSSQIVVADLNIDILDTDLTTVSSNHDTLASAKAIKDFIDVTNTIAAMTDTTVSSIADNNHLQYDSVSSTWVNRTFLDFTVITTPTSPATEEGRLYLKEINSQNNALAIKLQKAAPVRVPPGGNI